MAPERPAPGRWSLPAGLTLLLVSFYFLTDDGAGTRTGDPLHFLATAGAWLDAGRIEPGSLTKHGPMNAAALLPFLWASRNLGGPLNEDQWVSLHSNLAIAASCLLVYGIGGMLGYGRRRRAAAALVFGLATHPAAFARSPHGEPLQMTLMLAGLTGLLLMEMGRTRAGTALAALVMVPLGLLKFFALGLYGAAAAPVFLFIESRGTLRERLRREAWRPGAGRRALFLAGAFGGSVAAQLAVNRFARGSLFAFGYGGDRDARGFCVPLGEGLFGLILSPGKGFFFYSPVLILAALAYRRFLVRAPAAGLFAGLIFAAHALGYAKWWAWSGDWTWGPRMMLPATAFAALPLLEAPALWRGAAGAARSFRKAAAGTLLAVSLYVQVLGMAFPWFYYFGVIMIDTRIERMYSPDKFPITNDLWMTHFIPSLSPLAFHHRLMLNRLGIIGPEAVPPWRYQGVEPWNIRPPRVPLDFWWVKSEGLGLSVLPPRDRPLSPLPWALGGMAAGAALLAAGAGILPRRRSGEPGAAG